MNNYTLGIDASRWQDKIDWALLKAKGVDYAILKYTQGNYFTDPKLQSHYVGARSAGMIVGAYHWVDPSSKQKASRQVTWFKKAFDQFPADFICLDIEQYWEYWTEYYAHTVSTIIPGERISGLSHEMAYTLRKDYSPTQVVVYTNPWFPMSYSRAMFGWMGQCGLWYANYPLPRIPVIKTTWEDLKKYYPKEDITFPKGYPVELKDWRLWQWSGDKFILPGVDTRVDLNFYDGSVGQMILWCGGTFTPTPPVVGGETYVVNSLSGLRVRTGPGLTYPIIKVLANGTVVQISKQDNGWGFSPDQNGWMSMGYLRKASTKLLTNKMGIIE